ncbi:hydroxyacylglutathione hydrolase [Roseobacter sinensis]|uniref:Hydroxyacylglutathione hydrolase n=1 Tax=Roseobacter sinensis TaxID=2931391 RepID=A0ABT3BBX6_9RHOB|nr:hydroxyacylglutathione hydrolase [Roseobacter sp. WL0113]MCV3270623.1 hydroxyacylglutathione hydrolase [Roseobacter sp. WL0113]
MALELVTIPCLSDNYAFLLHDDESGATALVDIPEAAPILAVADARDWAITEVWITHHHADHVQGLPEVLTAHGAVVRGGAADAHRLPPLDHAHAGEETFEFAGHTVRVIDVPGHTTGHIAYHVAAAGVVFTADSLMALGCGRLFEGTAEQMWASLQRLMALPSETTVCSGHEYTASNAKFALTIDPDNSDLISRSMAIDAARAAGEATVPSTLALEMATNPFLRASDPNIRARLGMTDASDVQVFAEIRARKDAF